MRRFSLLSLFLCMGVLLANAQTYGYFERYTTKEGLSSNTVMALAQDSYGHIWIGTDLGLNRYDGISFYRYTKTDYPELFRNDILHIQSVQNGDILVGSYNGLILRYDYATDHLVDVAPADFEKTYFKGSNGFYVNNNGTYALTTNGFYQYADTSDRFENNFPLYAEAAKDEVGTMYVDLMGRYWIVGSHKVSVYQPNGKCVFRYKFDKKEAFSYSQQLLPVNAHRLMFAGLNEKLCFFDIQPNGSIRVSDFVQTPFSNVRQVVKSHKGGYWFATDGDGLWHCDGEPMSSIDFTRIMPYDAKTEEFNKLYTLLEDCDGNLWVGTQNSGLWSYRINPLSQIFTSAQIGMKNCVGSAFTENVDGNLIVASDGMGVYSCSRSTHNVELFGSHDGLTSRNVTNVCSDMEGNIWVTTWGGGLFFQPAGEKTFTAVDMKGLSSVQLNMLSVSCLSNGEIWVCSCGDGIYVYKNGEWSHKVLLDSAYGPEPDNWPSFVVEGENGIRWIVTSSTIWIDKNGVSKPLKTHYQGESKKDLRTVLDVQYVKGYGFLVATNQDVLLFNSDGSSFKVLDFLPKGDYSSVCVDHKQRIWTSGSNGIISIDLKNSKYYEFPMDFSSKGANYFVKGAHYVSKDGILFFGDKDGFFSFNPDRLPDENMPKHVGFSNLYVDGQRVEPNSDFLPNGRMMNNGDIYLSYDKTNIQIDLDVVDFSECKSRCSYKLDGLSDKWTSLGLGRTIKFSYIPPGDYILRVRYVDGETSGKCPDQLLHIHVSPPWWNTWWFRGLILLLIVGYVLMKWRNLKMAQVELQRKVDERTSELREKNVVIEQRNTELNTALSYKDKLIAVVAHDLKNPMFAIVGALDGLVNKQTDAETTKTVLNNVLRSARTLQDEMVKLLAWATSKEQELEYRPGNTHLQKIVDDDIALLRIQMETKGLTVTTDYNLQNYAYVDSRMISAVVRNLLNNSIKFTPSGKSLHVKAWQENKNILLQLSDEGVGMSAEKVAELQTAGRHQSTDGTSGEKGTGLGSGIAREYVLRNNGTLQIESTEGVGSTFTITLPAADALLPDEATEQAEQTAVANMQKPIEVNQELIEGNTIVVVDDDPLIRDNIKNMLDSYVNVLTAANGVEALEIIKQNVVDIVLSDVEMPVMNGIDMSRELAKSSDTDYLPILFLSAKSTESDRLMGLLTGAIDYIPKPFSRNELLIKITNILGLRRKTQQRLLAQHMSGEEPASEVENADAVDKDGSDVEVTSGAPAKKEEAKEEKINPQLQQILDIIEKNYKDADYSVERLADDMCMSKITLYRRVKTLSDKTPVELLSEYRLNKGLYLLKHTDVAIGDVAFQVGFSDPAYFTRRFKSFFGYPPSSVRE